MKRNNRGVLARAGIWVLGAVFLALVLPSRPAARTTEPDTRTARPGSSGQLHPSDGWIVVKEQGKANSVGSVNVLPDQLTRLLQYALINTQTCQGAPGSWAMNSNPLNGAASTGIITKQAGNGICPGVYFQFAAIYYTWTGSTNGQNTDSFSATWSQAGNDEPWTFDITLSDAYASDIGKTLGGTGKPPGNCGCPDQSGSPPVNVATGYPGQPASHPGDDSAGDPVNVATGNLLESAIDYTTAGQNPMQFARYYNSFLETTTMIYLSGVLVPFMGAVDLGGHWRTNYDRFLVPQSASVMSAERPDGRTLTFTESGGVWTTDTDVGVTLTNNGSTWLLTDTDDTLETYTPGTSGALQIVSVTARGGYMQKLTYNDSGQVATVKDMYGRTLSFTYSGALINSVTTPDNTTLTYGYGASGMNGSTLDLLTSVTYPTSPASTLTYLYENNVYPYEPFELTGITDEDGNRFATWSYDGSGRVLTSLHAGGADLTTITYNDTDGSRTVTNVLGQQETDKFAPLQGVPKLIEIDRQATNTTSAASRLFSYDGNGYLASATDWNGNLTDFSNNTRGLQVTIMEAVGTPVARTTSIAWDPAYHLPTSISTAGLTQRFAYNREGLQTARTDAANGLKRSWVSAWKNALLASVTGPRMDVAQTTSFSYGSAGQLSAITNALGQTTSIPSSTGGGLPLTIADPNGVITQITYDARQRPLTQTVVTSAGNYTTSLTYDAAGNLTSTQLPDKSYLANTYDQAHRLIMKSDALGDTIAYTLDMLGDRKAAVVSKSGSTTWQHADMFDALGRVIVDQRGAGQTTIITRDLNGNPLTITDPLSRVTTQAYDALNRVSMITDPAKGVTGITYDAHDRVTKVVAPNGAVTTYQYDGFGRVLQRGSPDTGTTAYGYDLADNLTQSQDAAGVVTNDTYDALNRRVSTSYPGDAAENVSLTYDQAGHGFGIGRLTGVADAVGSLSLSYDERGNELGEARTSGALRLTTQYAYDAASRVAAIAYPSGTMTTFGHDLAGQVTSIMAQTPGSGTAATIVSGVTYMPFGPPAAWVYGNGLQETRTYDASYRAENLTTTGVQALGYSYNAADNVIGITDGVNAGNGQSFGYDALDHLTGATGAYGTIGWAYDGVGNRLTQTLQGGASSSYGYLAGSNILSNIMTNGQTTQLSTSAAGNILSITPGAGKATNLSFNQMERLATESVGGRQVAGYSYDAFGRRFSKVLPKGGSVFQYDPSGLLLEEANNKGALKADTIYLNGAPVADVTDSAVFFFHTDRLGTPQLATTTAQAVAWRSAYQPFGVNSGSKGLFTQSLRFPGQYADAESGFYQNGFRDYNPAWGRYVESDPIGLAGGLNTYGYVGANPQDWIDQSGLQQDQTNGLSAYHSIFSNANHVFSGIGNLQWFLTRFKLLPYFRSPVSQATFWSGYLAAATDCSTTARTLDLAGALLSTLGTYTANGWLSAAGTTFSGFAYLDANPDSPMGQLIGDSLYNLPENLSAIMNWHGGVPNYNMIPTGYNGLGFPIR